MRGKKAKALRRSWSQTVAKTPEEIRHKLPSYRSMKRLALKLKRSGSDA